MNIYELKNEYLELQQLIANEEINEEFIADTLESLKGDINDKAESYCQVRCNLINLRDGLKNEAEKFSKRASSIDKKIKILEENLSKNIQSMNIDRIETQHFKLSFRKSESVKILDGSIIPQNFIEERTLCRVDKVAIKKMLKSGKSVEGTELIIKKNIQIK